MKLILISLGVAVVLIGGVFVITSKLDTGSSAYADNVTIVGGKQIIDLRAKGGYRPKQSTAKAGIPTILKVDTSGTFDCSSIIRIPGMNITKNLPPSGSTEIDLGNPQVGLLQGTCGMGMYRFEINFQG